MRGFLILLALLPTIFTDHVPICLDGFTLVNNKCLRLFSNPVNHAYAVTTCSSYYGTLVTIKNSIDNRAIASFVGTSIKHLWIGLYCFQSTTSNCLWDDASGSTSDYSNFASGFPLADVGSCVYYSVSGTLAGQWISDDCDDDLRPFVCETPTTFQDSCSYNYNGHCYFPYYSLSTYQTLSFDAAESACGSVCGHLVSMHSPSEVHYVKTHLDNRNLANIHIGALTVSGRYHTWTDGSAWNYDNIDTTSQLSGNCMMMALATSGNITQDAWYPSDCMASRYYVCKRPAGTQCVGGGTTTVLPSTYSPNQNCDRFIMAPGTFTSPGYPGNYTNNLKCAFSLATLAPSRIRLSFNTFYTESGPDNVWVYDGDSADAPLLNRLTGHPATPIYFESSRNRMFVVFITDVSVVAPGFSANFLSLV